VEEIKPVQPAVQVEEEIKPVQPAVQVEEIKPVQPTVQVVCGNRNCIDIVQKCFSSKFSSEHYLRLLFRKKALRQ
jgi:hypothetical protein